MQTEFIEGELKTIPDCLINSLIMEQASDTANKLTELECKLLGIECYKVEMEDDTEVSSYTEEAQDIFNVHYDEQMTALIRMLNTQLKTITSK
jgi:hypothetical protein